MEKRPALPRILVYQDEDCSILLNYLEFCGFGLVTTTEETVMKELSCGNFDLCILCHYKLSPHSDLKLLHYLRKLDTKMPVIFLSGFSSYEHIIEAIDSGADDYVVRPYNLEELVCRIKALLRRCGTKVRRIQSSYKIGNYDFDTNMRILSLDSTEIKLTDKESKVLAFLCAYENELLPKDVLLHSVWQDSNYFNKRSLDVHICRLRNMLSRDNSIKIETVRGVGHSLVIMK